MIELSEGRIRVYTKAIYTAPLGIRIIGYRIKANHGGGIGLDALHVSALELFIGVLEMLDVRATGKPNVHIYINGFIYKESQPALQQQHCLNDPESVLEVFKMAYEAAEKYHYNREPKRISYNPNNPEKWKVGG